MSESNNEKKPKTWDEAINELQAFIIKSKKEEREKAKLAEEEAEKTSDQ